jgi:hypothetical protein
LAATELGDPGEPNRVLIPQTRTVRPWAICMTSGRYLRMRQL